MGYVCSRREKLNVMKLKSSRIVIITVIFPRRHRTIFLYRKHDVVLYKIRILLSSRKIIFRTNTKAVCSLIRIFVASFSCDNLHIVRSKIREAKWFKSLLGESKSLGLKRIAWFSLYYNYYQSSLRIKNTILIKNHQKLVLYIYKPILLHNKSCAVTFVNERTWWRSSRKRVERIQLDVYVVIVL